MPPLARYPTNTSIRSWWSDSNPAGATINLHTLAKPLLRVMYDREVRKLLKLGPGNENSGETVALLMRYLGARYVAASTKIVILGRLSRVVPEYREALLEYRDCITTLLHTIDTRNLSVDTPNNREFLRTICLIGFPPLPPLSVADCALALLTRAPSASERPMKANRWGNLVEFSLCATDGEPNGGIFVWTEDLVEPENSSGTQNYLLSGVDVTLELRRIEQSLYELPRACGGKG
ncbi:hypothetical protein MIND_01275200 [Mycena indigotica]|uniref:Uncharacterized protein n=1 Tax=Mycena indigotica TaxID=2126181 RepID=A0A8H6S3E2_9AGAR|nr:uncharacterized protein MIND_01275200 [Mycena indigotica]KAF7291311.1 hypothetical protein MIND_01275200 [Mycena indigotica]